MNKNVKSQEAEVIDIIQIQKGRINLWVVGEAPIQLKCMSQKVLEELMFPHGKKTAVDKSTRLKHNPIEEYRDSVYRFPEGSDSPTLLGFPAAAFKRSMLTAALDLPGSSRAQIGRLVHVDNDLVPLYGVPQMNIPVTRMGDMARTPDTQARAIIPKWAAHLSITFVKPLINAQTIARLLAAAGQIAGVGDGRAEKGKLDFGLFRLLLENDKDEELASIIRTGVRKQQIEAMRSPACYNTQSAQLLQFFHEELARRQAAGSALKLPEQQEQPTTGWKPRSRATQTNGAVV